MWRPEAAESHFKVFNAEPRIVWNHGSPTLAVISVKRRMSRVEGTAYSPCHITGFFTVHDRSPDASKVGSTGAGVALDDGVVTRVSAQRTNRSRIAVKFNGRPLRRPVVSETVVREYLRRGDLQARVKVSHHSPLPIGTGYGTSGAGALSLSLALGNALGIANRVEASQIAHEAEIRCRTGLGTVTAVFHGGFLVRLKPGAPGVAEVRKLPVSKHERVVSASLGTISTSTVLSRRSFRQHVNLCGRGLMANLLAQPRISTLLTVSKRFTQCLGLTTPRLHRLIEIMDSQESVSAQMMIGEGIFSIMHKDRVPALTKILRKSGLKPNVSRIALRGAHLV